MHSPRLTRVFFALEALNSLSTTYFFYYLYFYTKAQFGFDEKQNLILAAALGGWYGIASIIGGRLCQRRGYITGLKIGLAVMCGSIGIGAIGFPLPVHIALMFAAMFGMALTWPPLEALVSEGQSAERLNRNIGVYNILWAAFGALAYFSGGAMYRAWGFEAMFLVPASIQLVQLAMLFWAERAVAAEPKPGASRVPVKSGADEQEMERSPVPPSTFLTMAWVANPFAYLAINTVIAVLPGVTERLGLSLALAGVVGSIWQFVRTGAFGLLWLWDGWHYRFRWLAGAYAAMALSFVGMLLAPNVAILIIAQLVFGAGLALIYYSSLYYSMHVGDTKGEHGGIHEAMIGAGCCAGPAIGAVSMHYFSQYSGSGIVAVGGLLLSGFAALTWLRWRRS